MLGIGSAYGFEKNTAGKVRDIVLSQFHPNPDLTDWTFSHLDDELYLIPYMKNGFWKCRVVPIGAGADKSITAEIIKMVASSYGMPQEFQWQLRLTQLFAYIASRSMPCFGNITRKLCDCEHIVEVMATFYQPSLQL